MDEDRALLKLARDLRDRAQRAAAEVKSQGATAKDRSYAHNSETYNRILFQVRQKYPRAGLLAALPGRIEPIEEWHKGPAGFLSEEEIAKHTEVADLSRRLVIALEAITGVYPEGTEPPEEEIVPSIFLSHSARDKFFVRKLAERLKSYGVKVWLDEAEINVGDSLTEKIGEAIEETDFVGVVLSHNSVNSEWVQRELQVAIQKELAKRKVVVLPLLLEPVELPSFLKDKLYADFTTPEKFDETFLRLLKSVGIPVEEKEPPLEREEVLEVPPVPIAATPRLAEFEDIRIVGLDDRRSHKPDPSKLLFNMYLTLSAVPPEEWQRIFEAERRFPRHTMWRGAWIEGQSIVIHCVPEEIDKYHLQDLKEDVRNSNSKYRQYLMEEAQAEARKTQKEQAERDQLAALKRRLRFD